MRRDDQRRPACQARPGRADEDVGCSVPRAHLRSGPRESIVASAESSASGSETRRVLDYCREHGGAHSVLHCSESALWDLRAPGQPVLDHDHCGVRGLCSRDRHELAARRSCLGLVWTSPCSYSGPRSRVQRSHRVLLLHLVAGTCHRARLVGVGRGRHGRNGDGLSH